PPFLFLSSKILWDVLLHPFSVQETRGKHTLRTSAWLRAGILCGQFPYDRRADRDGAKHTTRRDDVCFWCTDVPDGGAMPRGARASAAWHAGRPNRRRTPPE